MAVLLTGGTGFVGSALIDHLMERSQEVTITSRSAQRARAKLSKPDLSVIEWKDPVGSPLELPPGAQFDAVVNLMGESIAEGRWTENQKKRIRESRTLGTRRLVDAVIQSQSLPKVMVSASAIGIYGDSGEEIVEESHQHGTGFLTEVCEDWEVEANRLADHGVRVVNLRIGIVLGKNGGAMEKMVPMFRWCLGGKLGSGKQWMAWIHLDDLVAMIGWAIENESIVGPLNATAPNPVRNIELTKTLASAVGRPAILPAPKFGLKLVLGEFADSLFFSQRVVPAAALASGFQFKFADVESAISEIVN
ncbi:MAG: TIGR01777 family oxidoreductase [Mariniblastus sp.]